MIVSMSSPIEPVSAPVSPELILSELRGLAQTQNARFDGVERDQNSMRDWMGRLSDGLERQMHAIAQFANLETRLAHQNNETSDIKLEIGEIKDAVGDLQKKDFKSTWFRTAVAAGVAAIASPLVIWFVTSILHIHIGIG